MARRSRYLLALCALVAIAFLLRVIDMGRSSLWYDEIIQAQIAGGPLSSVFPRLIDNAGMPLDYLIERAMLALGSNEFILRFPAAAFSTLAVVVLYRVGRAMFGPAPGMVAAALLSISSFAIYYAREARPYSLYLLFVTASFYWLYRALQTNRLSAWLGLGLCLAGAVLAHLFALFVVVAQGCYVLGGLVARVFTPQRATLFRQITRTTVAGGLVAALLCSAALALTPNAQFVAGSAGRFLAFLLAPSVPPRDQWFGIAPGESPPLPTADFVYTRILESFSGGGVPATALFVLLGVVGLTAARRKAWETVLLMAWALLPSLLIILFLIHRATLFASRYLIPALPAWLLLCALGILAVARALSGFAEAKPVVRRAGVALLLVLWLVLAFERIASVLVVYKEDWRAAGEFLDKNVAPGDAVVAPSGSGVVYYYAPGAAQYQVPSEFLTRITDLEKNYHRVWLVNSRYTYDPGDAIGAWLAGRGAVELDAYASPPISIYYWRPQADRAALLADARDMHLPDSPMLYLSLGKQVAAAGDQAGAEQFIAGAIARAVYSQEAAAAHAAWGDSDRRAGNLDEAVAKYRAALSLDANQFDALVGLARIYLERNRLTEAYEMLTRARAAQPDSYATLFFLAQYYKQRGENQAAQQYYSRAAQLVPDLTIPP